MGDGLLDELVGVVDVRQRLLQVDDVDAVALGEDEALHLRVPATGLVPEVDAALEQLLHGDDGHCSLSALRAAEGRAVSVVAGTGWCTALASCGATHPAVARRDRGGDCPAVIGGMRTREVDPSERAAPDSIREAGRRLSPAVARRPQIRAGRLVRAGAGPQGRRMRARVLAVLAARRGRGARAGRRATADPAPRRRRPRPLDGAAARRPRGDPALRAAAAPVRRRATAASTSAASAGHAGAARPATASWSSPGWSPGRPVVSIDHADGLRTTYEPVDPSVGAGQRVTRGSPIGTLVARPRRAARSRPACTGGCAAARPTSTRWPCCWPPGCACCPWAPTGGRH